jgi:ribosomal-protein-alanine N-acetyltransferase
MGYRIPTYQVHCANFGFLLDRKYWGKGYMSEAVQAIIKHCFDDLGLERLEATCDLENMASARVMEKCGMIREGIVRSGYYSQVLKEYRDVYLYAIVRSDYESKTGIK